MSPQAWDEACDDEHEEEWCVDHGASIEVMTSSAIRAALADGRLRPSQKVWCDGHPCWHAIADFDELMPSDFAHERTGRFEVPRFDADGELSGPRRIRRPKVTASPSALRPAAAGPRRLFRHEPVRKVFAFISSLLAGIFLGLLLFLPFALF